MHDFTADRIAWKVLTQFNYSSISYIGHEKYLLTCEVGNPSSRILSVSILTTLLPLNILCPIDRMIEEQLKNYDIKIDEKRLVYQKYQNFPQLRKNIEVILVMLHYIS